MGQGFAGALQSLLDELGGERLSQNEKKGGNQSKFAVVNHARENRNMVSGSVGDTKIYRNAQI